MFEFLGDFEFSCNCCFCPGAQGILKNKSTKWNPSMKNGPVAPKQIGAHRPVYVCPMDANNF